MQPAQQGGSEQPEQSLKVAQPGGRHQNKLSRAPITIGFGRRGIGRQAGAMRQNIPLVVVVLSGLLAGGCGSLGWYRSIGNVPGVAPSDYAFYDFCGTSSQVFQFSLPQVQTAAIEALRDLGFKDIGPVKPCPNEALAMKMHTPDGWPATITFTPQNRMTNMRIVIGPAHVGDQMLSRDVFRRVALNFGTLPRDYMPLEPTLARRINPPHCLAALYARRAFRDAQRRSTAAGREPDRTRS